MAKKKQPKVNPKNAELDEELAAVSGRRSDDLNADEIAILHAFKQSAGWQILQRIMKVQIDYLTEAILSDDDLSEIVKITHRDLVRKWLALNKKLYNLPEELTKMEVNENAGEPLKTGDPYASTMAELRAMKSINDES